MLTQGKKRLSKSYRPGDVSRGIPIGAVPGVQPKLLAKRIGARFIAGVTQDKLPTQWAHPADAAEKSGVWKAASIDRQPRTTLVDWAVYEIKLGKEPERTRHFVGRSVESGYHGRTSSAVVSFDAKTAQGITRSGRVYRLKGPAGSHPDARYTWNIWLGLNPTTDIVDVTRDIEKSIQSVSY